MNTIKKLTTLLLALLLPTIAVAEDVYDFKVDGIYYKIVNDEACVTYKSFSYINHDPHYESDYAGDVVIPLAEAPVYLATSPKSNSAYLGVDAALDLVRRTGNQPVPLPIRNAPTQLMKELGYHKNYKYAHDFDGNFVDQEFLPDVLQGHKFYEPGNNAREAEIRRRLQALWKKYNY